jgi:CelD/BcsL family acetyltransferase involved in cellulose biosynthesis
MSVLFWIDQPGEALTLPNSSSLPAPCTALDLRVNPELSVQVHTSWQTLAPLREVWDALLEQNATRAYFLRYSWNQHWWQSFAPARARLHVLVCRDAVGGIWGIAPLYVQLRGLRGVGVRELNFLGTGISLVTSEHLDVLASCGHETRVVQAMVGFLSQKRDWDRLRLVNVPAESKALTHWQQLLQTQAAPCDQAPFVDTQQSWGALRQSWSGKFRYNIERGQRRLSEGSKAEFVRVSTPAQLTSALDDFVRLHQMRWTSLGKAGSFADEKFEAFLRFEIQRALASGSLRFWTYSLNDRCVATLMAFVENGVAHYFQSGFDVDYQKHSLGSVMVYMCLQDCVTDEEIREFDFMGGSAAYKGSWTSQARVGLMLDAWRPGFKAWCYSWVRKALSALRLGKRAVQQGALLNKLRARKWLGVGLSVGTLGACFLWAELF